MTLQHLYVLSNLTTVDTARRWQTSNRVQDEKKLRLVYKRQFIKTLKNSFSSLFEKNFNILRK